MDAWQLNLDCSIQLQYEIRVWENMKPLKKKFPAGSWRMEFNIEVWNKSSLLKQLGKKDEEEGSLF